MPFLINLRVTKILCSFRIALKRKAFPANNFASSDAENNTLGTFQKRGIADLFW